MRPEPDSLHYTFFVSSTDALIKQITQPVITAPEPGMVLQTFVWSPQSPLSHAAQLKKERADGLGFFH